MFSLISISQFQLMGSRGERKFRDIPQRSQFSSSRLSDDNLRKLNSTNKKKSSFLIRSIEREVDIFFHSLDQHTKSNLSKSQVIRSREKVYTWGKDYYDDIKAPMVISEEYIREDLDPALFNSNVKKRKPHQSSPKFSMMLDKETFENQRLIIHDPNVIQSINNREISITDWMAERSKKYKVHHDLIKRTNIQDVHKIPEYVLEQYSKVHNIPMERIKEALEFKGKASQELSTNELIILYMSEVPEKSMKFESMEDTE